MVHDVAVVLSERWEDPRIGKGDGAVGCVEEFPKVVEPVISCSWDGICGDED